jgi:hypothetical protein
VLPGPDRGREPSAILDFQTIAALSLAATRDPWASIGGFQTQLLDLCRLIVDLFSFILVFFWPIFDLLPATLDSISPGGRERA